MIKDKPKVFFFTKEAVPSDEELDAMEALGFANVCVRNAGVIDPKDKPEGDAETDYVAGAVPDAYEGYTSATDKPAKAVKKADAKKSW